MKFCIENLILAIFISYRKTSRITPRETFEFFPLRFNFPITIFRWTHLEIDIFSVRHPRGKFCAWKKKKKTKRAISRLSYKSVEKSNISQHFSKTIEQSLVSIIFFRRSMSSFHVFVWQNNIATIGGWSILNKHFCSSISPTCSLNILFLAFSVRKLCFCKEKSRY